MMMSKHYPTTRTPLPAISETFPQFNRPPIALISPLDLSLRASNLIPITPPSTPSPPRKRSRLMSDEHFLWRPHALPAAAAALGQEAGMLAGAQPPVNGGNYVSHLTYVQLSAGVGAASGYKNHLHAARRNFCEIPERQLSVQQYGARQQPQAAQGLREPNSVCPIICVDDDKEEADDENDDDDETIILTEDEDETTTATVSGRPQYGALVDPTNASNGLGAPGKECVAQCRLNEAHNNAKTSRDRRAELELGGTDQPPVADDEKEEEEEYVDVLSNDDDDANPLNATAMLRSLQQVDESELEQSGKVLTRRKLVYDDETLHNRAVEGLALLFDRDFGSGAETAPPACIVTATNKTYIDLSASCEGAGDSAAESLPRSQLPLPPPPLRPPKSERRRTKLRKNLALDEETISPVSGTIIRKLRDDEELVVRKGDIDPAFNVVEITEEAKAILASIDNKIGAYLCQLCRTLYDDAFQLAQHRCPRIVHIEYKCADCEKVFNCPANLASHRRWHKPKAELLAAAGSAQSKKRPAGEESDPSLVPPAARASPDKPPTAPEEEGAFPCAQCGKAFRRHAYLKKHQLSHQMLENLKTLDLFKSGGVAGGSYNAGIALPPPPSFALPAATQSPLTAVHLQPSGSSHPTTIGSPSAAQTAPSKSYSPHHLGTFPFPPFDQRRFYTLGELYFSQQLERSSAFQYVQATNQLCQLSGVSSGGGSGSGSFLPRMPGPAPLGVK